MLSILNTLIISCILLVGIFTILSAILAKMEGIPIIHSWFASMAEYTRPTKPSEEIQKIRKETLKNELIQTNVAYDKIKHWIEKAAQDGKNYDDWSINFPKNIEKRVFAILRDEGFKIHKPNFIDWFTRRDSFKFRISW